MLVHSLLRESYANGPGRRAVLWVQGCSLSCKGCFNSNTHPFTGEHIAPSTLAMWSISTGNNLSVSGGECLQQPVDLLVLFSRIHCIKPDLSIGIFTGYSEPEIEALQPTLWPLIRRHLDFAIMGRYVQKLATPDAANMLSSSNQKLRLFTNRYTEADFNPVVEITITDEKSITTGFPVRGQI